MDLGKARLGPFLGIGTTRGDETPLPYAADLLNVRLDDGKVAPRWGYGILSARAANSAAVYGLEFLNGYDDDYSPKTEFVVIEGRDGRVAPYSVDPATGARTEIGTGLSLAASAWRAVMYGGTSYWINPDSAASVYRHEIGNPSSWEALETLPDAAPLSPLTVEKQIPPYIGLNLTTAATTFAATTNHAGTRNLIYNASGQMQFEVFKSSGDTLRKWAEIEITFNDAQNLGPAEALMYRLQVGQLGVETTTADGFNADPANHQVQVVNSAGAVSSALAPKIDGVLEARDGDLYARVDLTALTSAQRADVKKLRIRFGTYIRYGSAYYRLVEVKPGGMLYTDLGGATLTGDLSNLPAIEWAYNYTNAGETSDAELSIPQVPSQHIGTRYGNFATFAPSGAAYTVKAPATTDPVFTAGTTNLYRRVNNLWRRIATGPANAPLTFEDNLRDSVIVANPVTYPVSTLAATGGAFDGRGILGGFAMLSWVCWLYPGGIRNVRHSFVGDPERQAGEFEDLQDETRGATFALSDDLSDEPVAGVAIGNAAVIFGTKGVHVQAGNSPSTLTPPRRIIGAPPIANADAFAPLAIENVPGVAYVDKTLEGVWWIGQQQLFDADGSARPAELTLDQRGLVREWLTSAEDVRVAVDEATGALWVVSGARALRLTPTNPTDGRRQWVKHQYALPSAPITSNVPVELARTPDAAVGTNRTGHNVAWSNLNGCLAEGGGATNGTLAEGSVSRWLDVSGFTDTLPIGAVIASVRAKVRRRTVPSVLGTSVRALEDYAGLLKSGVLVGADKSALVQLPETAWGWQSYEWSAAELGGLLPGDIPNLTVRLGWRADVPTGTGTPANWSVAVAPGSPVNIGLGGVRATTFDVTPSWIGAGTAPPWAKVRLTATAWAGAGATPPAVAEYEGTATADNGLGATAGGAIKQPTAGTPPGNYQAGPTNASYRVGTGEAKQHTITTSVTLTSSGAGTGPLQTHTLATLIQTPDTSTLEIDAVLIEVVYTVATTVNTPQVWRCLAFTPARVLAAATNAGRIDRLEWNGSSYYTGLNRDGGQTMPGGYWRSGVMRGPNRRLTHVEMDGTAQSVTVYTDEAPAGVTRTFTDRTQRYPMSCRGWNHAVRVDVSEAETVLSGLNLRTHGLSERLDR